MRRPRDRDPACVAVFFSGIHTAVGFFITVRVVLEDHEETMAVNRFEEELPSFTNPYFDEVPAVIIFGHPDPIPGNPHITIDAARAHIRHRTI